MKTTENDSSRKGPPAPLTSVPYSMSNLESEADLGSANNINVLTGSPSKKSSPSSAGLGKIKVLGDKEGVVKSQVLGGIVSTMLEEKPESKP